jgi:penicillin-binding protein 1C
MDYRHLFSFKIRLSRFDVKWSCIAVILLVFFIALAWPMRSPFPNCYSTLIFDKENQLLRVFLAEDDQVRFPPPEGHLPEKYQACLLNYEDRRYFYHPGVDPVSLVGAVITNMKSGTRIRGGSTLTMQVARLSNPKERTYWNKLREMWIALRLNCHFSKNRILHEYAAHVPMGGNIVGIEAASYAYYGKSWNSLTWAEAALFVVLPNSPSQINPKKSRTRLIEKRNQLLRMMYKRRTIDSTTCVLSSQEPLPDGTLLPFKAPHFTQNLKETRSEYRLQTTLDSRIQQGSEVLAAEHHAVLRNLGVANLAVLIAETQTGKIRAYIGSQSFRDSLNGQVDGVRAFRSTGSLLKPFLVALTLDRGPYTMQSVLQDVPTFYGTFAPQNASKHFSGLATLHQMLLHSLNVPAIRLLNWYGLEDFYSFLKSAGLRGLFRTANEYGLPLILGGAEASLTELVQCYLALGNLGKPVLLTAIEDNQTNSDSPLFSHGAAWLVLNTLNQLSRPGVEYYWHYFNHQVPVAWKTGTSYGQKDGWAIGVNRQWTIGVWVGNFTGEGNASISGAKSAAPLLFDLFNRWTDQNQPMWFDEPENDLVEISCCRQSGYPAGPDCAETILLKRPVNAYMPGQCPYHERYWIDRKTGRAVCSLCWQETDTIRVARYIVPPAVRDQLEKQGVPVDTIPTHLETCPVFHDKNRLEIIYPLNNIKVFIPRDLDGVHEKVVFKVKHQQTHARCFWFLNGRFLDETAENHTLAADLDPGTYRLTVQDQEGFTKSVHFTVYKKSSVSN